VVEPDPGEDDDDVRLQVNDSLSEYRDVVIAAFAGNARVVDTHLRAIGDALLQGPLDHGIQ
jgi:hypothetical protein